MEPLENRWLLSITVNTLVDELDGDLGDGDISLRDAITAASAGETVDFAGSLDGGTIVLDSLLGELAVAGDVTIDASSLPGHLTIDAGHGPDHAPGTGDGMRVFNIDDGDDLVVSTVEIRALNLTGGDVAGEGGAIRSTETLQLVDSTITGNATGDGASGDHGEPGWNGGGIWSYGTLTLIGSTISGNSTGKGGNGTADGSSGGSGGFGGGIYSYGTLSISGSTISGNSTGAVGSGGAPGGFSRSLGGFGGGIYSYGTLTITSSTISGNSTGNGSSGAYDYQGYGGGIYTNGMTAIDSSTISGNTGYDGGGIYAGGSLAIANSTISNNSGSVGAGVLSYGTTTVSGSTISGNSGDFGGGLWVGGTTTVSGSTISGNSASYSGGGLAAIGMATISSSTISANSAGDDGGGIHIASDIGGNESFTLTGSTVSGNMAGVENNGYGYGGGLYNAAGLTKIQYSTISGNSAPDGHGSGVSSNGDTGAYNYVRTEVHSSIIAGNTGSDVDVNQGATNSFGSLNYNVIGTSASSPDALTAFTGSGDQTGVTNPGLGPLADNGGPTWTHALQAGSPALDAGDPAAVAGVGTVPLYDQRGAPFGRVEDGGQGAAARIDIGAYEWSALAPTADFDIDGDIDGSDFLSWQRGFGTPAPEATGSDGDANGDLAVDGADLAVWQDQFGMQSPALVARSLAGAVSSSRPESTWPSSSMAGVVAIAAQATTSIQAASPAPLRKEPNLDFDAIHWLAIAPRTVHAQTGQDAAKNFDPEQTSSRLAAEQSQSSPGEKAMAADLVFTRLGMA